MALGSFKALGGVYAVARLIAERWEDSVGKRLEAAQFLDPGVRAFASNMTFVCASAGNHGMAVAAGARLFGAKARIYLSRKVPLGFEIRLQAQGAEALRVGESYEESVTAALADANAADAILLADGSWPGYTHPPSLVMEGYTVFTEELREVFEEQADWPTHVYLQAGVGGLAGATAHMVRATWKVQPRIIIVEPEAAACLKRSDEAGRPVRTDGPMSNMGRLDCKEPSIIAHTILNRSGVEFVTVSDGEALAAANDLLTNGIATTPSGAAGLAAVERSRSLLPGASDFKPLVIVTEGSE